MMKLGKLLGSSRDKDRSSSGRGENKNGSYGRVIEETFHPKR